MRGHTIFVAVLAAVVVVAAPVAGASGQPAAAGVDSRWLPWLGCWLPEGAPSAEADLRICVAAADGGVRIQTRAGGETVFEETIIADGIERAVTEPECRGTRRAEWSADGQRLFSNAQLACDGQEERTVSGLTALTADARWIDVQVIATGSRENVRVRRYRRSAEPVPPDVRGSPQLQALAAADSARGTRLTIDHVIEATAKASPRVVEALLFETRAGFPLDSRRLLALDEAGVPETIIDLMVAFSFPSRFDVRRSSSRSASSAAFGSSLFGWGLPGAEFAWPWYSDPFYAFGPYSSFGFGPYSSFGFGPYSPYLAYTPFAYSSRFWGWGYGPGGDVISGGFVRDAEPRDGNGRVVNGSGYTEVLTRTPVTRVAPRTDGGSDASSGGASSSGPIGTAGVTSGGYSSGSGGGGGGGDAGGGRTAVPR